MLTDLITVDTTSLDQHKLFYLHHRSSESENCLVSVFQAVVIPSFREFNIPFKSNASKKPKENIFYTP